MSILHSQNGIYRILEIEVRAPGKPWKRIRGDEVMSHTLSIGVQYELRVRNPAFKFGLGIDGAPIETPDVVLPLHD